MALRARALVDGESDLRVTDTTLAEAAYVMETAYQVPRHRIVARLTGLVEKQNISVMGLDKRIVVQALEFCGPSGRVSFADALIWAEAVTNNLPVYTFDRRFPNSGVAIQL